MAKNFLVPINMNGLEIQNFLVHNLPSVPTGATGKLYFNTTDHKLYYYDGSAWIALEANPAAITIDDALSSTSTNPVQNKVINTALGNKVDKVSGKGLSENDFTTTLKNKLDGIAAGAEVNVQSDWNVTSTSSDAYIKNKPSLGAAALKNVDGSIASGSASTNLPTSQAVADFVSTAVGAVDAMRFKGTIGTGGTVTDLPTSGVKIGDTYRVITAGTYAGHVCEVGDLIIAIATTPTWAVAQTNITGISKTQGDFVTGGSKTSITPVTSKTVVTSASGATASYANGVLTITNGSFGTGDSVTAGTAVQAYTSLTTGKALTDVSFTTD